MRPEDDTPCRFAKANLGVICPEQGRRFVEGAFVEHYDCDRCGWNPDVAEKRHDETIVNLYAGMFEGQHESPREAKRRFYASAADKAFNEWRVAMVLRDPKAAAEARRAYKEAREHLDEANGYVSDYSAVLGLMREVINGLGGD